ncbi:glycosyltransferase family 1 protein [Laetiporus sulphureus 93-53]|uniref:UDP-N-acetylglucosamine transferase subunit ALG14 n=1 Tax=Laetiporus sulphureus 93-53 TaxID=1314785 RepID=A0A165GZ24_9APHY|nr:glycosyltransferase family 1 protein [Laetiporus sulphureus 93-53]KZT11025.1 glycosyltransferase family 1 protein [Laetiporus sulphureus 93-53]
MFVWICGLLVLLLCAFLRLYYLLPGRSTRVKRKRLPSEHCSLAVFLGSGGHTSEALMLLSALDFDRYFPRTYIISEGDALSAQKAVALESLKSCSRSVSTVGSPPYTILTIPRARRVHQSLYTAPFSAIRSLVACLRHITLTPLASGKQFSEVLILNGPGTCFVLCIAAYLNRFLGSPSPTLIYIESFARVRTLSLSGKLLRPFVDRFVVQWPELLQDGKAVECRGWLV